MRSRSGLPPSPASIRCFRPRAHRAAIRSWIAQIARIEPTSARYAPRSACKFRRWVWSSFNFIRLSLRTTGWSRAEWGPAVTPAHECCHQYRSNAFETPRTHFASDTPAPRKKSVSSGGVEAQPRCAMREGGVSAPAPPVFGTKARPSGNDKIGDGAEDALLPESCRRRRESHGIQAAAAGPESASQSEECFERVTLWFRVRMRSGDYRV